MRTRLTSRLSLLFMAFALVLALPAMALASSVDVTSVVDVTTPEGSVSLAPGGSENITINLSVTGNQEGTATFEVNRDWVLQSNGTFVGSNPKEFTVAPRSGGDPATILSTTGTVSVASGVAAGGPRTLTVGVFDITNSNTSGGKLAAGKSATYNVTVTAPPPPSNTAPQVSVSGVSNGDSYEIGSVPTPGCSVVDAEDTNESATPDVGAISGTLAAYGLGSQTVTCTYTDGGGITRSASVTYSIVDTGNPTSSHQLSAAANANGWHNQNVTVTLSGSDGQGSGVKEIHYSATGAQTISDSLYDSASKPLISSEGTTTFSYYSVDNAGNESTHHSFDIKLDKTAPQATENQATSSPNANGWYKADVTNHFAFSDGNGSGLADTADASIDKTTGSEGTSVKVSSGPVSDLAGNTNPGVDSAGFKIDKTKPVLAAHANVSAEATGPNGATVSYTNPNATETLSGLTAAGVVCQPASGALFALGSTQITCSAEDNAGNAAESTNFDVNIVDTTAPALNMPQNKTAEATDPNGAAVSFARTASDLVDGNVAVECSVGSNPVNSGDIFPLGTTQVDCSATDAHGNTASDSFTVTVQDTTAPALTLPSNITKLATGNSVANVTYSASANDIVDGSVAINCTPASGTNFAAGTTTVNCSASDAHNNKATGSFTVTVTYNFAGFRAPVDNGGIFNAVKAGQSIPMKFSLSGNQGLGVIAAGFPKATAVACPSSTALVDQIEETTTANNGLTYDATADQYNYVWKTPSTYAGKCYQFNMVLMDGTSHTALFKFTK